MAYYLDRCREAWRDGVKSVTGKIEEVNAGRASCLVKACVLVAEERVDSTHRDVSWILGLHAPTRLFIGAIGGFVRMEWLVIDMAPDGHPEVMETDLWRELLSLVVIERHRHNPIYVGHYFWVDDRDLEEDRIGGFR